MRLCWLASVLFVSCASSLPGPKSIGELIIKVYGAEAPDFTALPSFPHVAVANNDTAILKVQDLQISHYPLKKGRITFLLRKQLVKDILPGAEMDLVSYIGDELLFNGTVPVCDYLIFARMQCPVLAAESKEKESYVLEVPEHAGDGRLSFVSRVTDPGGDLIVHIAGLIDLINDGTVAKELKLDGAIDHDEL